MESEDEDVIFENSVLHQTLQELGVTDIATEPKLQTRGVVPGIHDAEVVNDMKFKRRKGLPRYNFITRLICSSKVLEEAHFNYRYQTLQRLVSSQLLSEEDKLFLQFFIEDDNPLENPIGCMTVWTYPLISLVGLSLVFINFLPFVNLLLPWILSLLDATSLITSFLSPYYFAMIVVNFLWMFFVVYPLVKARQIVLQKVLSGLEVQDKVIQDLEIQAWELMYLERKCLRLVKESELVARGFTVASQHHVVSRVGPAQTSSLDQWCPELRQMMLKENIELMSEMKQWIVRMLQGIPMICVDSDFNTLEDLKFDLNASNQSGSISSSDQTVTDIVNGAEDMAANRLAGKEISGNERLSHHSVVPPSQLSRSVELLSIYISGYIRRLALCFYHNNLREKNIDPYAATQECTKKLKEVMKNAHRVLSQQYKFYRAVHQSDQQAMSAEEIRKSPYSKSKIYNLYVCVNSLDLHLQSMLHVTRDLTVTLEEQIDRERHCQAGINVEKATSETNDSFEGINSQQRELWMDALKIIKSSLESCKGCYEESLKHVSHRANTVTSAPDQIKKENKYVPPEQTRVRVIAAEDPVIVDQVFEANSESGDEDIPSQRPQYTPEDKKRLEEQRETMKRLRQEIQAVVSHRAISHREREKIALARARGEEVEVTLEANPSNAPMTDGSAALASSLVGEVLAAAVKQVQLLEANTGEYPNQAMPVQDLQEHLQPFSEHSDGDCSPSQLRHYNSFKSLQNQREEVEPESIIDENCHQNKHRQPPYHHSPLQKGSLFEYSNNNHGKPKSCESMGTNQLMERNTLGFEKSGHWGSTNCSFPQIVTSNTSYEPVSTAPISFTCSSETYPEIEADNTSVASAYDCEKSDLGLKEKVKTVHRQMGFNSEPAKQNDLSPSALELLEPTYIPIVCPDQSSNFTKSIAMVAAARARTFISTFKEEEAFEDSGSDSEMVKDEK